MASKLDSTWLGLGALATVLSGAAWWLGTGLAPWHWMTWFAPLPVLLLAPRVRWLAAMLAAIAAGCCAGASSWHYLHDVIKLPLALDLMTVITPGIGFALCVLLFRKLWLDGRLASAALAPPALWGTLDYLGSLGSPHGTWGSLAYTQMDAPVVIQVAALTGLWGVGFLMLLLPSAVAVALLPGPGIKPRATVGGAALLLVAAAFLYGQMRLQEPAEGSMRLGLVSLKGPVRPALDSAEGQAMLKRYLAAIDGLAAKGAKAVVLPETAFAVEQESIPQLAASAARLGIVIDTGAAVGDAKQGERNMALAYSPAAPAAAYAKHHLIPGFESRYRPGTGYAMAPGMADTGLAICKDMDFHDIGNAYAGRGAQLLLVPAWDFVADGWLHGRMAIMRGVESGFALARAARNGRLTLSDDRGRVLAEASDDAGDAQLVADLPLRHTHTLYAAWGDWFAWLELALLVFVLSRIRFGNRQN
ncbi:MAG TPA: nitrilase-related carbon-nitrogen hydrolase [Burkholderiaceae bacterium]